ncbi:MAG: oxidative damage protection protein [Anaerolineales bacterium]|nr:oxidative damage protection protein [Anaerolineales bacterium]
MSVRMVKCVKLGRELPGLPRPPFPSALGKRIFENVSQQGWDLWQQQSTLLINHYGLNMADKRAQQFLIEQLEDFFFGPGAEMPEGWTPEGEGDEAPAPAKGGGKGAPAPQRK